MVTHKVQGRVSRERYSEERYVNNRDTMGRDTTIRDTKGRYHGRDIPGKVIEVKLLP